MEIYQYRNHLNSYIKQKLQSMFKKERFDEKPGVSIILCSNRLNKIEDIFDSFLRQSYDPKELIIVLNNNNMNIDEYHEKAKNLKNIKIFQLDETLSLGYCFKFALNHAAFDYIAKFDDDDYYGTDYLKQAMNAFNEINCDVVGKASYYIYFHQSKILALYGEQKQNMFVNRVADSSLVFKRSVLEKIDIPLIKKAGAFANIQSQFKNYDISVYSTDKYNYLVNRYNDLEHQHTWKVSDTEYLKYPSVKIVAENIENFIPYIENKD
ncbi:glycosyltransferase family A protein [Tissierella sp. MB52-C2]|uniref:glycosyltransferase family 2 protein n=1 Tax=Tissierella sp. MB52-C2 TaxID=3070999 RepID=UPI00280B5EB7|nr:glycosyltransferase family A protein [Tissierella sp. MB52-C2]WMM23279.1 glycosyltransferase family A protein [Tissierella sp. MB52-C2]